LKVGNSALHVVYQANAGHGEAVMNGYRNALALGATYVFQTDSDDQFDREDFWKLWALRDKSSFIMGVRSERHDPLLRIVISRINATLIALLFFTRIRDANVPFRLMSASFLEHAFRMMPRGVFAPNIFLAVIAKRAGVGVEEVPVLHRERQFGEVSIRRWKLFKVCLRSVRELIAFRFHGSPS
jgi:dolichol-phosphate mannosyltransferase